MPDKKVLIITYYWPPSGGSGVQRWLKFVKYLPEFGWKPYVCTPENPALVQPDQSLLRDVSPEAQIIHLPIWEPYNLFFKLSGSGNNNVVKPSDFSQQKKRTTFQRVAAWIRGNIFIPDPKIFWVKPTVKFLHRYIKEYNIHNVITTGPPHSVHLIGLDLKKKNPTLNWVADFRDPWSEWSFLDSFQMTSLVRNRHRKLEREVITKADCLLTVTPYYVERFRELSRRNVEFIPNGFDPDDFKKIQYTHSTKFVIRHVGIVYDVVSPEPLVKTIEALLNKMPDLETELVLEFVGEVGNNFQRAVQSSKAGRMVQFRKPVSHNELMVLYGESSMLLLNLTGYKHAEGLLPGKLFEYFATGLPILGIGPLAGDAAHLINNGQTGKMFDPSDIEGIAMFIKKAFMKWKNGEPARQQENMNMYSRKNLTQKLTTLLVQ